MLTVSPWASMNGLDALPYSTQPTTSSNNDASSSSRTWVHPEAHVAEGDCLVFAGDALARLTWNFYPSLLHRPSVQLMVDGGGGGGGSGEPIPPRLSLHRLAHVKPNTGSDRHHSVALIHTFDGAFRLSGHSSVPVPPSFYSCGVSLTQERPQRRRASPRRSSFDREATRCSTPSP